MSRTLSAGLAAQLIAGHARPVLFAELQFSGGTTRVCSWNHDLSWDAQTWLGAGYVGGVGPIEESAQIRPFGLQLTLSGIPAAMMSVALGDDFQRRKARLWFAVLDANHQVDGTPYGPFIYRMDTMDGEVGRTGRLILHLESVLANLRPRLRRYTHEDQSAQFADDRYFEFLPELVDKVLY